MRKMGGSLKFKVLIMFSAILTPLFLFLLLSNLYAMNVVKYQVADSNSNMISLYVKNIDKTLDEITEYLNRLVTEERDISTLATFSDMSIPYAEAVQRVLIEINNDIRSNTDIDSVFLYSRRNKDLLVATLGVYDDRYRGLEEKLPLFTGESRNLEAVRWKIVKIEEKYYLYKVVNAGTDIDVGAIVDINRLVKPLDYIDLGSMGGALIMSDDGSTLSVTVLPGSEFSHIMNGFKSSNTIQQSEIKLRDGVRYLIVGKKLSAAPLNFIVAVPEKQLYKSLSIFQYIIFVIPILVIIIVSVYLTIFQGILFKPMRELVKGMWQLMQGNPDATVTVKGPNEFHFLLRSFNDMATEIKNLKINVYEEKIKTQKAELKHLQLQINPHFFSNSLYVIYNLANLKDYKTIQKMVLHLSDYFRFIIQTDRSLITLEEEMGHVKNYLDIQKIRFPDVLSYELRMEEVASSCRIPPLIVQTFVENSIIHGFSDRNESFTIKINIFFSWTDPDRYFEIIIEDNGKGFDEQTLERIKEGSHSIKSEDKHIGIWNVHHRLKINYGDEACITFENNTPKGAVVRLLIPHKAEWTGTQRELIK